MLDGEYFIKPYRARLGDMQQPHDSLDSYHESPPKKTQPSPNLNPRRERKSSSYLRAQGYPDYPGRVLRERNCDDGQKGHRHERKANEQIWDYLYQNGLQSQKEIENAYREKQFKIDTECTFQPMVRKSSRYRLPTTSSFMERNCIWQENKLEKIVR